MAHSKLESPTTRRLRRLAITQLARVRARLRRIEEALERETNQERRNQLEHELEAIEMSYDNGELEVRQPAT